MQSEMIEAKPKVNQLQRYAFYPKVAEICEKWEDISNRIQVCIQFLSLHKNKKFIFFLNFIIHCLFAHGLFLALYFNNWYM